MWKSFGLSFIATVVLATTTPSCAQETIKAGAIVSTTGPLAFIGEPEHRSLQMLTDTINASGGVLGRKIELISYDDSSDPAKANGLAKRLVENDKVDVLLCGASTGASMAMVPIAEKAGVPFISCAGGAVVIDPVKRFVFKTPGTDRMQAERAFNDMKNKGIKHVALLTETSGYGQSGRKESLAAAPKFGIEIVADETYGAKDTDITAQLAKIRSIADLQAIFVFGAGQASVTLNKNIAQLGITTPHYESAGVATSEYVKLSGASAEGVRVTGTSLLVPSQLRDSDPQKKVLLDYANAYTAKFKEEASPFGGYAYDTLAIYVDAVKRANTLDKEKVRDAIEHTEGLIGVTGIYTMSPTDHLGLDAKNAFRILEIRKGEWNLLD